MKTCKRCLQIKELNTFKKEKNKYRNICKKCEYNIMMINPKAHKARLIRMKRYRDSEKGKTKAKEYSQSIMGKVSRQAAIKRYEATEAGYINKYNATAKRRAARIKRTPKWLTKDDLWLIKQAYELAALRTKQFGFKWHVDHIIPLQGKLVSGLHVIENLQVIPGTENIKKYNKVIL